MLSSIMMTQSGNWLHVLSVVYFLLSLLLRTWRSLGEFYLVIWPLSKHASSNYSWAMSSASSMNNVKWTSVPNFARHGRKVSHLVHESEFVFPLPLPLPLTLHQYSILQGDVIYQELIRIFATVIEPPKHVLIQHINLRISGRLVIGDPR